MNTARMVNLSRPRGLTLIETLMIVMVVGIVILAGAAVAIAKLFTASEISTEASNITQIATNLRNLKDGDKGYSGLNTKIAVDFHVFPLNMSQRDDGTVVNSWDGAVTVGPVTGDINHFALGYGRVPKEACSQLALKLRTAGWARFMIGGTPIAQDSSLEDIGNACRDQAAGNEFVFEGG